MNAIFRRLAAIVLILTATPPFCFATELSPTTQAEIEHLFRYLGSSGCQFNRNDSWYTADEAVAHLRKKYDYLNKKDMLTSAESFVQLAATESSMSGKAYQVKCGNQPPQASALWFSAELKHFRAHPGY